MLMTPQQYETVMDEFERLESQFDPWEDDAHRRIFVESFESYLDGLGFTWNDWLDSLEDAMARKQEHRMELAASD